jgi:hypothetical protein
MAADPVVRALQLAKREVRAAEREVRAAELAAAGSVAPPARRRSRAGRDSLVE